MATLREYFDTDFARVLSFGKPLPVRRPTGNDAVQVQARVHLDFDSNTKYVSCFIPETSDPMSVSVALLKGIDRVVSIADATEVQTALPGEGIMDSRDLQFSGRVFLYTEDRIPSDKAEQLCAQAKRNGLYVQIRGPEFAARRSALEKPLAFICHDSRDKDLIARPIALGLRKLLCPVWFDEYSLNVGDRLRESIERGLRECRKCVLIVSPHFLNNPGWTKVEFNSVFTRELLEQKDLILPVWHDVDKREVFNYSPTLADRLAVKWSEGEDEVVRRLRRAIVR
jgi:TIR domain-containing protein